MKGEPRTEQLYFIKPGDAALDGPKNALRVLVNQLNIIMPKIRDYAIKGRQTLERQVTGERERMRRGVSTYESRLRLMDPSRSKRYLIQP